MSKEIPKKVIDVTGVELWNALGMGSKVMNVVVMNATTFYFVFPNMI